MINETEDESSGAMLDVNVVPIYSGEDLKRANRIFQTLGDVVGPIDASVRCTLIALWHVEMRPHNVFPKRLVSVTYEHTNGPLAFSVEGPTSARWRTENMKSFWSESTCRDGGEGF